MEKKTTEVPSKEARSSWAALIRRAHLGEVLVITIRGIRVCALVPMSMVER